MVAAFVAITVAGPRRIFTGLPLNRGASNYGPDNYTLAGGVSRICWLFFLALRHMISQNTIEMVTIHMNVLRTTMEAASSGSWRYFLGPRNYKDANNVKLRASLISMSAPQLASEMPPSRRCK